MDRGPCLKQDSQDLQDLQDDIPRGGVFTVARGPVPRDRSGKPKTAVFTVARGPVPRDRSDKNENHP